MSTSGPALPNSIHISTHPCVRAKLSQLRSKQCDARATNRLVHEIATIVCSDALASCLQVAKSGQVVTSDVDLNLSDDVG
jgi:uracil phosphoribosyltransferase